MRWVQLWAARATPLGAKDAEALDAVLDAGFTPQQVARWLCLVREEPLLLPGKRAKVPALRSLLRNHRRMRQALGLPEPGTWLTPFGDAWAAQYGGVMPYGVAARALKPLCVKFGAERVLTAFRRYLARTSGVYASVPRFASTFGEWDGPSHAATDAPVRVTLS